MKKQSRGIAMVTVLSLGLLAQPIQGQDDAGLRSRGPNAGQSLEVLLEMQEELELSGDQLAQIQELKGMVDSEVTPLAENIRTLRQQIWDGEVDWDEGGRQLQALQGALLTASAPLQGRVQEILTVQQHQRLQQTMWLNRPGQGRGQAAWGRPGQGRGGAFQGRPGQGRRGAGFRGAGGRGVQQGQFRGSRGGIGLRQGFNGQGRAPAFGFRQVNPRGPYPGRWAPGRGFRRGGTELEPVEGGNLISTQ